MQLTMMEAGMLASTARLVGLPPSWWCSIASTSENWSPQSSVFIAPVNANGGANPR